MKKARLSITIERELLAEVNDLVRRRQREALDRKAPPVSRSVVLERLIRRGLRSERKH